MSTRRALIAALAGLAGLGSAGGLAPSKSALSGDVSGREARLAAWQAELAANRRAVEHVDLPQRVECIHCEGDSTRTRFEDGRLTRVQCLDCSLVAWGGEIEDLYLGN